MTVKKIAELCGVDRTTVLRWVYKLNPVQNAQGSNPGQNAQGHSGNFYQGIINKLEEAEKSGTTAANLTLDETLAIIGEGGENKALASLLAENAANRNAIAVRSNDPGRLDRIEKAIVELAIEMKGITSVVTLMQNRLEYQPKKSELDEAIHEFYRDHIIPPFSPLFSAKRIDVWTAFKGKTEGKFKSRAFFERFHAIYPHHPEEKIKKVTVLMGVALKNVDLWK